MNKEYLREWYLAKVEEYKALAAKAETFDTKEKFFNEVENYKREIEKLNN